MPTDQQRGAAGILREEERRRREARGLKVTSNGDSFVAFEGDLDLSALDREIERRDQFAEVELPTVENMDIVFQHRITKLEQARSAYVRLNYSLDSVPVRRINSEIAVLEKLIEHMGMGMTLEGAVHFYQSAQIPQDSLPEGVREEAQHFHTVEFKKRNSSRWSELDGFDDD